MGRILTDGNISIGAYTFPDRKKPLICIDEGDGNITAYGYFNTAEGADEFMNRLGKFIGAEE